MFPQLPIDPTHGAHASNRRDPFNGDDKPDYLSGGIEESPAWGMIAGQRRRFVSQSPSFARSVKYAFEGVHFAFRNERNFRMHCVISAVVIGFALALQLPAQHIVLIAVLSLLVLCAELMNTAIESTLDLQVGDNFDPTVKSIKDMAAASVLVVSVGAALLGASLFLPVIIHRFIH